jgi:hypothetical protein
VFRDRKAAGALLEVNPPTLQYLSLCLSAKRFVRSQSVAREAVVLALLAHR